MIFDPLEQFEIFPIHFQCGYGYKYPFIGARLSFLHSSVWRFYFTNLHLEIIGIVIRIRVFSLRYLKTISVTAPINSIPAVVIKNLSGFVINIIRQNSVIVENQCRFLPLFIYTFVLVLAFNRLGRRPYHFTVTSHFSITLGLSMIFFISFNIIGMKKHSRAYLGLFLPSGVPVILAPLLVGIEIISYFARVISLATRLFANRMAGHTLRKILIGFSFTLFQNDSFRLILLGFGPRIVVIAIVGLEFVIAFLQAYVFITLLAIYLNDNVAITH